MEKLKLGLIPSPDLPAELTGKIVDDLPDILNEQVDENVSWEPEIVIDPLVGTAEYMNQLMDKVVHLKDENNWDYVICLIDLPNFMKKHIIMADISRKQNVSLIHIPAFGSFPIKRRIKATISKVMLEMYTEKSKDASLEIKPKSRQVYRQQKREKDHPFWSVKRIEISEGVQVYNGQDDKDNEDNEVHRGEETQESTQHRSDVRYVIQSKLLGLFRVLTGMIFANQPWKALSSLKKVLVLAFGTGIYVTLFPTPWKLSTIYSTPRFILLMVVAMVGMVGWMIFAHNMWEKPTKKGDVRLRKLYNVTTVSTFGLVFIVHYIVLFCIFLATLYLFVPADLFEATTDVEGSLSFKHYAQLAWLSTSLGMLAGAIGATGENEDTIRNITYSYRQINRYHKIQDEEDNEENQSYAKQRYEH